MKTEDWKMKVKIENSESEDKKKVKVKTEVQKVKKYPIRVKSFLFVRSHFVVSFTGQRPNCILRDICHNLNSMFVHMISSIWLQSYVRFKSRCYICHNLKFSNKKKKLVRCHMFVHMKLSIELWHIWYLSILVHFHTI